MNIIRTGIFATQEESDEVVRLYNKAQKSPVIGLSGFSSKDWDVLHKTCHKYALAHGLPEIEAFYGLDFSNLEFVTR